MMSAKFKVGDRVVANAELPKGFSGVVRTFEDDLYSVEFEGFYGGHSCSGDVKSGNGWWLQEHEIDPASPAAKFQVVYMPDGDETFDTLAAAENAAEERAENEIGSKVAVVKVLAVASVTCKIERFA